MEDHVQDMDRGSGYGSHGFLGRASVEALGALSLILRGMSRTPGILSSWPVAINSTISLNEVGYFSACAGAPSSAAGALEADAPAALLSCVAEDLRQWGDVLVLGVKLARTCNHRLDLVLGRALLNHRRNDRLDTLLHENRYAPGTRHRPPPRPGLRRSSCTEARRAQWRCHVIPSPRSWRRANWRPRCPNRAQSAWMPRKSTLQTSPRSPR